LYSPEGKVELLRLLQLVVEGIFITQGGLAFMAVLISPEGEHTPVMFEGDVDKEGIGKAIRALVKEKQPAAVVLISEAWTVLKPEENMTDEELRKYALRYGTVDQHRWKRECVALDIEYRDGSKAGYNWFIEKDEEERRVLHADGPRWANGTRVLEEVTGHLQNFFSEEV
jgi:hypothetical protein